MTKDFCDVCGREIPTIDAGDEYKIKVKVHWYSYPDHGWTKVEICNDCRKSFYKLWQEDETR